MGQRTTAAGSDKPKKLIEAGYTMARRSSQGRDGLDEDSEIMNLPESMRSAISPQSPDLLLRPETATAFSIFQDCASQWRVVVGAGRTGLDYTAVLSVCRLYGSEDRETFDYIRALEIGTMRGYDNQTIDDLLYDT